MALASLSTDDLTELRAVAAVLLPGADVETEHIDLDHSLQPRGYRLLDKVPRISEDVVDRLVERFGSLQSSPGPPPRTWPRSKASTRHSP